MNTFSFSNISPRRNVSMFSTEYTIQSNTANTLVSATARFRTVEFKPKMTNKSLIVATFVFAGGGIGQQRFYSDEPQLFKFDTTHPPLTQVTFLETEGQEVIFILNLRN